MANTYSAGIVTAYGAAKRSGYTGTYDDFCRQQAQYADNAAAVEQAKTDAQAAATTATGKATEASTSATSAAGSASAAAQSATNAGSSATAASGSATAASNSATSAGNSATAAQTAQGLAETAQGKAEDAQEAAEDAAEQAEIYAASYLKAFPVDTASGSVANFPDGADDVPVKDLTVAIEPVQAGSGDPSPTNIRPISGWTGATVTRTGKNLLDPAYRHNIQASGNNHVRYYYNGAGTSYNEKLLLKQGVTYTFGFTGASNAAGIYVFLSDTTAKFFVYNKTSITFTPTEDGYFAVDVYWVSEAAVADVICQLEVGSTATAYEPYQGNTYDITFPSEAGTVYGGTLDVTTGVLTVNWAMVDMGTLNYSVGFQGYYTTGLKDLIAIPVGVKDEGLLSSQFVVGNTTGGNQMYIQTTTNYSGWVVFLPSAEYESVAAFKTAMSGVQLCYELATPITYQLTPQEVYTLLGTNNVWAETGYSTVEYRADTGLYIQKLTGSTEEDMVANEPIASGKYFFVGNSLYLSTTAIAAGATLTPGTNCVKTNLAAALNALNS